MLPYEVSSSGSFWTVRDDIRLIHFHTKAEKLVFRFL
jgi:hypothetical protein